MTLEEKFAEIFPEYVAGSVFLSPYWDLFEAGAEIATKKLQEDLKHKKIAIQNRKARIKDLEKQVADLEWQLQEVAKDNDNYQKENAELKEEMKAKQVVLNDFKSRVETVTDRFNKKSSQLTKAKEIISEFVKWANWQGSKCPSFKSIQDKAEQFIKE